MCDAFVSTWESTLDPVQNMEKHGFYGSIADVIIESKTFDLGNGLLFERAFVHITTTITLNFGNHATRTFFNRKQFAYDPTAEFVGVAQIRVPKTYPLSKGLSRSTLFLIIVSLLRLRLSPNLWSPFVAGIPINDMNAVTGRWLLYEAPKQSRVRIRPNQLNSWPPATLRDADLAWVSRHLQKTIELNSNPDFNVAFRNFSEARLAIGVSHTLMLIWSNLENLLIKQNMELTRWISLTAAAYLEPPGVGREQLFEKIKKLYGDRSKAAHGSVAKSQDAVKESYELFRRILTKVIESGKLPTPKEFEKNVLSGGL